MKIRQIEYFLEVEKTLNITKAAQNMYVSQTAVTKQLQLLEEELGFALFSRENKRMQLTNGGVFFKKEATQLMDQYRLTKQNVSAYRSGGAGCLNIGFVKNMDENILLSCLTSFKTRYPEIEVNLFGYSNQVILQHIQNASLDIGFGFPVSNSCLHCRVLKSYPLVLITSQKSELALKSEIFEWELQNILFDVRNCSEDDPPDFEGLLAKIACGYGNAVVHQFAEWNRFRNYLAAIPLMPLQEKEICLIYDEHCSPTGTLFIETCF